MSGAAAVLPKEVDLSTRVASSPGVYGAIVIRAKKGPVGEPQLMTSDSQLLSVYTPDERVDVGMDLAFFSALAFLEKSNKLWVTRAAKQSKYGGLSLKASTSAYNNFALATGMTDPTAYVFDSGDDVAAVAEVTQFVFSQLGTFYDVAGSGLALQLHVDEVAANGHYFWFNVTDGGNVQSDPNLDGTAHQVDILAADTADQVATKFYNAVAALVGVYTATNTPAGTVTATNVVAGLVTDASATGLAAAVSVTTQGAAAINTVDEAVLIYGSSQGAWADDVGIKVTNYATDPDKVKEPDSFIIEVFKASNTVVPVETFVCSRVQGALDGYGNNIFVEDALSGSNYIRAISNPAVDESINPKDQATVLFMNGGDDGVAVTDAEMVTASESFRNKDKFITTLFMDGGWATDAFGQNLDSIATERMDSVALLSVPIAAEIASTYLNDIIDYRKTTLNLNSSYSALFTPHVLVFDRFNNRRLYASPDGYAGAAISFSAANFEIWFPPAGFKRGLVRVLDLRRRFTKGELDALYDAGINPLRFAPGKGIAIWGQKTLLARPSALDRLNVRLLLVTIEPAIAAALEDFLFELNDVATRNLAVAIIDTYMEGIKARKGVDDFLTVSDDTNNTASDIDNNRMNVDLYIKPKKAVEYIPFRVVVTSSGVSFQQAQASV